MQIFLIGAVLIAIALALFAFQNSGVITVNFLTMHFQGSLALILGIVFCSGFITGILTCMPSLFRKSSALREQKRKVKQIEENMRKPGNQHKDRE